MENKKLYLKGYKHKKCKLEVFLYRFLTVYNATYCTYYSNTGSRQCLPRRGRSLGDIHLICRSYFPTVKRETVKNALLNFGTNLVGHYCSHISKRVYEHRHLKKWYDRCSSGRNDEYGDKITYKNENKNKQYEI
jgi:hypothetical protein